MDNVLLSCPAVFLGRFNLLEFKKMTYFEDLQEKIRKLIEGNDGFFMPAIFPFHNHSYRVDINQIAMIDEVYGTQYTEKVRKHGWQLDINQSLWGIYSSNLE